MGKSVIPKELIKEIKTFNCVLFVGAGITTERTYYQTTFLEHIKKQCQYTKKDKNPSFPDVMQYYCQKVDGGRKNKLIREIIEWIEPFSAEGEVNRAATMFFREIARIPFFKNIVTTNWDPFCERTMNILVPMVEDKDIPFWDDSKRQVLKIHGCISRPRTVVATSEDYNFCMKDRSKGAIFTKLRDLMATKTFVFAGYSLRDPDFRLIYDEMINNLGPFRRGAYVIDHNMKENAIEDWGSRGIKILKVSGITFARELNRHLEKERIIPSSESISFCEGQLTRLINIHMKTSAKQELPEAFASAMYQDGLLHSLEQLIENSRTGKLMEDFSRQLNDDEKEVKRYWKAILRYNRMEKSDKLMHAMVEMAYWTGRVEALKLFVANSRRDIPPFISPNTFKPTSRLACLKIS